MDEFTFMVARTYPEAGTPETEIYVPLDQVNTIRSRIAELEAENKRIINIAGEALGFSEFQRDQDTVEVLAHHAKRLGEELSECKAERDSITQSNGIIGAENRILRARCERLEGALREISNWNEKLNDECLADNRLAMAQWRGCIAIASRALEVPNG